MNIRIGDLVRAYHDEPLRLVIEVQEYFVRVAAPFVPIAYKKHWLCDVVRVWRSGEEMEEGVRYIVLDETMN